MYMFKSISLTKLDLYIGTILDTLTHLPSLLVLAISFWKVNISRCYFIVRLETLSFNHSQPHLFSSQRTIHLFAVDVIRLCDISVFEGLFAFFAKFQIVERHKKSLVGISFVSGIGSWSVNPLQLFSCVCYVNDADISNSIGNKLFSIFPRFLFSLWDVVKDLRLP